MVLVETSKIGTKGEEQRLIITKDRNILMSKNAQQINGVYPDKEFAKQRLD